MKVLTKILVILLVGVLIQLAIAGILIITGKGVNPNTSNEGLKFQELQLDYSQLPKVKTYEARDGSALKYRSYIGTSKKSLILIHGSGWHSQYFLPLATYLRDNEIANVYTPDLRGHGEDPTNRGDIDYIDQLEDDLSDFINHVKTLDPDTEIVLGGHSSGGGLVIRFAGSDYSEMADAYVLLAPFIKYNASTVRKNSGGWAYPYTRRIIGLSMLNTLMIHNFDDLPVIEFNMPEAVRDGTETLVYTYRMNTGYAPRNYKKDLGKIKVPLLVVVGEEDESFIAEAFEPLVSQYSQGEVEVLPNVSHMGVVVGPEIKDLLRKWLVE